MTTMTDEQIKSMLSVMVGRVCLKGWKEKYNKETASCSPEKVDENYAELIEVFRQHTDLAAWKSKRKQQSFPTII